MEYGNGKTNQLVWRENENRYHNDDFKVTADNLNVNVAVLSNYIVPKSKVLDIGCGEGKLGIVIKEKECELYGVDLDVAAAMYAENHNGYKKVFTFNIENKDEIPNAFLEFCNVENKFDVVVLMDVLEHVINPTEVIYNALSVLKDGGKILISIPNVNNGDIVLNLLQDRFNYRAAGVLDNTHTKYFTKSSFLQWIQEMNELNEWSLDCEYVGGIFGYTEYLEQIKIKYPAVYNFIQLNPHFHVIQHMYCLTFYKQNIKTNMLDALLDEQAVDMVSKLDVLLSKSSEQTLLRDTYILPNERRMLEEQISVANRGWKECAQALQEADDFVNKMQDTIEELKLEIQERDIEKNEIIKKWKETSEALQSASDGWKECADALEDAKKGWRECADALEETKKGWKECADALEQARKMGKITQMRYKKQGK